MMKKRIVFDTPRNELIRFAASELQRGDCADAVQAINIVNDGGAQARPGTLGYAMWKYVYTLTDAGFTRLCKAVERAAK